MDPFHLFEDAPSPYAFFGVNPPALSPEDWDAHLSSLGTSHPGWVFDTWRPEL
ncbi:hypothetical protein ABZY44_17080 [Streptomyces sp. NPDC006544]|uniref:hypothetical protein n=1 Tax=Streptomyces sp. NPDC006544 TaxID=3154583 RepID=UPI0033BA9A66